MPDDKAQAYFAAQDLRAGLRDLLRDLGFAIGPDFLIETWVYGGFVWFEMGEKLQYQSYEREEHGEWHEYTTRREFLAWFLEVVRVEAQESALPYYKD